MVSSKYKVIIFDIDDTLILDSTSTANGLKRVFEAIGANYNNSEYDRWISSEDNFWFQYRSEKIDIPEIYDSGGFDEYGRSRPHWVRAQRFLRFFPEFKLDLVRAYSLLDEYEKGKSEVAEPMPGGNDIINYLSDRYILVAATDEVHEIALSKLKIAGYADHFQNVFSPKVTGCTKPIPEYFNPIAEEYGNDRLQYLIIGNSVASDIRFAQGVGIDSCLYNHSLEFEASRDKLVQPTYIISHLSDIRNIL